VDLDAQARARWQREQARLAVANAGLAQETQRQSWLQQGYSWGDIWGMQYGTPERESRRDNAQWAISPAGLAGEGEGYGKQVNITMFINGVNDIWPRLQEALQETGAIE
jgi:hypothetical protein